MILLKLNLHILREDLADLVRDSRLVSDKTQVNCSTARPYLEGTVLTEGTIYVAGFTTLPERPNIKGVPSLISIGEPPKAYRKANIDLIVVDSAVAQDELLVRIADIFNLYDEWDTNMRSIVAAGGSLAELGRITQPLFENPLYCQGPGYKVMFLYPGDMDNATQEQRDHLLTIMGGTYDFKPGSSLPEQAIVRLLAIQRYGEARKDHGLVLYDNKNTGTRSWCYNIGPSGAHIGRLMVYEILREINDRDAALLCLFAPYIEQVLRDVSADATVDAGKMYYCVRDMLSHKLVSEEHLVQALKEEHWHIDDEYFCMLLEVMSDGVTRLGLQTIAATLDATLPKHYHIVFENRLVYVFNLTALGHDDEEVLRHVTPVFRDVLLHAGSSEPFENFKDIYYYYLQASEALVYGARKNLNFWYYRYRDYSFDAIIDRCQDKRPPEAFRPRGLRLLDAHDKKYDTRLSDLLKLYLQNNLSVTQTARASFSSRSTCIRHLQSIREISHLDLDDPHTRLELDLAFAIAGTDTAGTITPDL
jgi:hypothetical protein